MVKKRIKIDKRQAILDAAGRLLARRRFADVALDDIAIEANVAKGTLYLYFDSKDELYLSYVGQMIEPLLQALKNDVPVAAAKSAIAGIELTVRELTDFARRNPAVRDIMQGTTRASQQAAHEKTKQTFRQVLVDVLKAGIRRGELRDVDPELCADVVLAVCSRLMERTGNRVGQKARKFEAATCEVIHLLSHGLLAGRASTGKPSARTTSTRTTSARTTSARIIPTEIS